MNRIRKLVFGFVIICLSMPALLPINTKADYTTAFTYEAENMLSSVGHPEYYAGFPAMTSVKAETATYDPGFLIYGPYSTTQLASKNYRASFRIKAVGSTTAPVARLEVYNSGRTMFGDWDIYMSNFTTPGQFEYFNLDFSRPDDIGTMEYRVWFYDNADLEVDKIAIQEIPNAVDISTYQSEQLRRSIGHVVDEADASEGKVVLAQASEGAGYMQYGPYSLYQEPNNTFKATYKLKVSDNTSPNVVARIDTSNANGTGEWSYLDIKGTDFTASNTYQNFSIIFSRIHEGTMEYRIYSNGITDITSDYVKVEKITQSTTGYESENLPSDVGTIVTDDDASGGQARQALSTNNGYLQFGPYTLDQAAGNSYSAIFRMKVNTNWQNVPVARIEAYNQNGNGLWRYKVLKANDFSRADSYEDFSIDFSRTNQGSMEYRVYIYGNTSGVIVNADKVDIFKKYDSNWVYESENSYGEIGNIALDPTASNAKAREATVVSNSKGYLVYGPYSDDQPTGSVYTASFRLKTRNNSRIENIARVEVYNPGGTSQYVSKEIKGIDFSEINTWQDFNLNFARRTGGSLEFRVYFYDLADILSDKVTVTTFTTDPVVYQAEQQLTGVGKIITDASADGGYAMMSNAIDGSGYLVFGPYTVDQAPGNYEVIYRIKRGNAASNTNRQIRLDVVNDNGSGTHVWKDLLAKDIKTGYTDISVFYYRTGEGNMEYRVYTDGLTDITLDSITVKKI
jgi:hypothetical protein